MPLVAAMILSGFLGTVYGTALLERMPEETFRRWFRIGITVLALDLLRRGLTALAAQPQMSSATRPTAPTISRHQANSAKPCRET